MDVYKDPVGTEIAREEEKRFKVLGETGLPLGGREGGREGGKKGGREAKPTLPKEQKLQLKAFRKQIMVVWKHVELNLS